MALLYAKFRPANGGRFLGQDELIKDNNRKRLIFYIICHIVLFTLFVAAINPTFESINDFLSKLKSPSGLFPLLSFPFAIVLEGLIHSNKKAVLIFWRFSDPLPGNRAFSSVAPNDHRINLGKLKRLFPEGLPEAPRDQNTAWYDLYRKYGDEARVYDAHKFFLLTRDLASLTIVLIPFCIVAHLFWHSSLSVLGYHVLVMIVLALIICISSQNYGKRFVANVLVEATLNSEKGTKAD